MPVEIYSLRTEPADVWVSWDGVEGNCYAYGGCRMVDWRARNEHALGLLCSLMTSESGYKNTLINRALEAGAVAPLADSLPRGFASSRVGGARCVMRPSTASAALVMANPDHPEFRDVLTQIFVPLARLLNDRDGRIKLTPDFGRFAGMADLLLRHTAHVLGVSRELGGCGGKSTFSATGVIAAYERLERMGMTSRRRVVLVGSAGAMGTTVLDYFLARGDRELTVCDLKYDAGEVAPPPGIRTLPAVRGRFTDECLREPGCIIATTWGGELERSDHRLLGPGTTLLLAHNLALPSGLDGLELVRELHRPGLLVIPGQVLTLGGALTSRLEWFSRDAGITTFDKPMAHGVVRAVVGHWVEQLVRATEDGANPYESMLDACEPRAFVA